MPVKRAIFDKKNILIVGGAGFIGSHLCDDLVKANKVICLDNFITGADGNIFHLHANPNFKFINHDIINPIDLEKQAELSDFKIEFQGLQEIYYLASPASPRAYSRYPIETLLVNSVGVRNCLDLAVKYKASFLYASSAAVYGDTAAAKSVAETFVGPSDQLGPRACYSEAKRFGEALVNNYRLKYDLNTKIVRIFNCYGPRLMLSDGRMIPELIKEAVENREIVIYGDQQSAGSYLFISDLIRALVKMMESGEAGPVNLASQWRNTFAEVAQAVIKLTNSQSAIRFDQGDAYLAPQPQADITLAKEKLGWFPIILLEDGLKKTIDYLSAQEGLREARKIA